MRCRTRRVGPRAWVLTPWSLVTWSSMMSVAAWVSGCSVGEDRTLVFAQDTVPPTPAGRPSSGQIGARPPQQAVKGNSPEGGRSTVATSETPVTQGPAPTSEPISSAAGGNGAVPQTRPQPNPTFPPLPVPPLLPQPSEPSATCSWSVTWSNVSSSHEGCVAWSDTLKTTTAESNATTLFFVGDSWPLAERTFERLRACPAEGWRYGERLVVVGAWPGDNCNANVELVYTYDECPAVSPYVCAAGDRSACAFQGRVTLTPRTGAAAPSRANDCRPVGLGQRARRLGEACWPGECEAGLFCDDARADGSCSALGDGVCAPAPTLSSCGTEIEDLCWCADPPVPLIQIPLFQGIGTSPDGSSLNPNHCTAQALGFSVVPCPRSEQSPVDAGTADAGTANGPTPDAGSL
jgi:hypothetical protein